VSQQSNSSTPQQRQPEPREFQGERNGRDATVGSARTERAADTLSTNPAAQARRAASRDGRGLDVFA
jgi:hypothetical protein